MGEGESEQPAGGKAGDEGAAVVQVWGGLDDDAVVSVQAVDGYMEGAELWAIAAVPRSASPSSPSAAASSGGPEMRWEVLRILGQAGNGAAGEALAGMLGLPAGAGAGQLADSLLQVADQKPGGKGKQQDKGKSKGDGNFKGIAVPSSSGGQRRRGGRR